MGERPEARPERPPCRPERRLKLHSRFEPRRRRGGFARMENSERRRGAARNGGRPPLLPGFMRGQRLACRRRQHVIVAEPQFSVHLQTERLWIPPYNLMLAAPRPVQPGLDAFLTYWTIQQRQVAELRAAVGRARMPGLLQPRIYCLGQRRKPAFK